MKKTNGRQKAAGSKSSKEKEDRMAAWREIEATVARRTKPTQISTGRTWTREALYDRDEHPRSNRNKRTRLS
jgi:hypothetical protein